MSKPFIAYREGTRKFLLYTEIDSSIAGETLIDVRPGHVFDVTESIIERWVADEEFRTRFNPSLVEIEGAADRSALVVLPARTDDAEHSRDTDAGVFEHPPLRPAMLEGGEPGEIDVDIFLDNWLRSERAARENDDAYEAAAAREVASAGPLPIVPTVEIVEQDGRYFVEIYGQRHDVTTDVRALGERFGYEPTEFLEGRSGIPAREGMTSVVMQKAPKGDPCVVILRDPLDPGEAEALRDGAVQRALEAEERDGLLATVNRYLVEQRVARDMRETGETARRDLVNASDLDKPDWRERRQREARDEALEIVRRSDELLASDDPPDMLQELRGSTSRIGLETVLSVVEDLNLMYAVTGPSARLLQDESSDPPEYMEITIPDVEVVVGRDAYRSLVGDELANILDAEDVDHIEPWLSGRPSVIRVGERVTHSEREFVTEFGFLRVKFASFSEWRDAVDRAVLTPNPSGLPGARPRLVATSLDDGGPTGAQPAKPSPRGPHDEGPAVVEQAHGDIAVRPGEQLLTEGDPGSGPQDAVRLAKLRQRDSTIPGGDAAEQQRPADILARAGDEQGLRTVPGTEADLGPVVDSVEPGFDAF